MSKNISMRTAIRVDMSLIVSLSESLIIMNITVNISLSGISSIIMNRYINISMSFKVNPSESRKINAKMIASVSECEYWYEFKREFEFECEYNYEKVTI